MAWQWADWQWSDLRWNALQWMPPQWTAWQWAALDGLMVMAWQRVDNSLAIDGLEMDGSVIDGDERPTAMQWQWTSYGNAMAMVVVTAMWRQWTPTTSRQERIGGFEDGRMRRLRDERWHKVEAAWQYAMQQPARDWEANGRQGTSKQEMVGC